MISKQEREHHLSTFEADAGHCDRRFICTFLQSKVCTDLLTTANQMLDCSLCYIFSGYMPSNQVFMDCMQRFAKCTSCHVQHWINVQSNPSWQFFEFEMKANHII